MVNILKNVMWLELSPDAQRQFIDAQSAFTAWEAAVKEAAAVRGGMLWRRINEGEYLIRTTAASGAQTSLGPRSPETEEVYNRFVDRKTRAQQRLAGLRTALERHQKMNRALYVGRAPKLLVDILTRLAKSGLSEHFVVIGTHAIYAYEAAAGVFLDSAITATQDIDLLWDTRKNRVSFITNIKRAEEPHFLGVLRKVDKTFMLVEGEPSKAINSDGFEVDILRREAHEGDPNPLQVTDHDDDFYAMQARRAGILLNGPRMSQMIAATSGHMARMITISPEAFVKFKQWMADKSPDRDTQKRTRDRMQADVIEQLIEERLPHLWVPKEGL